MRVSVCVRVGMLRNFRFMHGNAADVLAPAQGFMIRECVRI